MTLRTLRDSFATSAASIRPIRRRGAAAHVLLIAGMAALAAAGLAAVLRPEVAQGGDWPEILGPHRSGAADGESLDAVWPKSGPPVLWRKTIGSGLAGVAVAGGRVVLFHRVDDEQIVEAFAAANGKRLWRTTLPTRYVSRISSDSGPRCVPVVHDDAVYLYGAGGELFSVSLGSGKMRWTRDTRKEFSPPEGYFGAGSTPIVEDGKLLVNVGGRDGAGIVAFDLADGKTVWKATDEGASYSSPVAATIDGTRHLFFVARLNVVSVDPKSGRTRFSIPFGQRGPTVNGANPLVLGDRLFLSSSYGIGAALFRIGTDKATQVWASDDVLSSQYPTGIVYKDHVYGIHGRDDVGVAALRCIDPAGGKVVWSEKNYGMATFILAGDKMLSVKTGGDVELLAPTPQGYRTLATAKISERTLRALPALSAGRLYVRDEKTLYCLKVGKEGE